MRLKCVNIFHLILSQYLFIFIICRVTPFVHSRMRLGLPFWLPCYFLMTFPFYLYNKKMSHVIIWSTKLFGGNNVKGYVQ